MATEPHYALNFDAIEPTLAEFFKNEAGYEYQFEKEDDTTHNLKIWSVDNGGRCKKPGIIKIYCRQGCYCLIVQGNPKISKKSNACKEYILDSLRIPAFDAKTFVLKEVDSELLNLFIQSLKEGYTVSDEKGDVPYAQHYIVSDATNASVSLIYYKTCTLMVQGIFTAIFANVITCASKELGGIEGNVIHELISLSQAKTERYKTDITQLVSNSKPLDDNNLSAFVLASAILANSGIELEEYSSFSFGVLKAIEGLLSLKLAAHLSSDTDSFCGIFEEQPLSGKYRFLNSINDFDSRPVLKQYIENAYDFYNKNRHTTFHVRKLHVETSRQLSYENAVDIIDDGLVIINGLCDNW